jgi:hypothetical protein
MCFDPLTGKQFGNFPQAYSHEELIRTVCAMLWHFDGEQLTIFPAIPPEWLVPGTVIRASNIPLPNTRAEIALFVEQARVRYTARNNAQIPIRVPSWLADASTTRSDAASFRRARFWRSTLV